MYTYLYVCMYLSIYLFIYLSIYISVKAFLKRAYKGETFSSKKNIAEENLFNRDVVGLAYFFNLSFTQTYTQASCVGR